MIADRYLTYVLSSAIKERVLKRSVESRGEGKQPGPVATSPLSTWKAPGGYSAIGYPDPESRHLHQHAPASARMVGPIERASELNVDRRVRPPRFSLNSIFSIYMTISPLPDNLSGEFYILSLASCNYSPSFFRLYKSLRILMVKIFPKGFPKGA